MHIGIGKLVFNSSIINLCLTFKRSPSCYFFLFTAIRLEINLINKTKIDKNEKSESNAENSKVPKRKRKSRITQHARQTKGSRPTTTGSIYNNNNNNRAKRKKKLDGEKRKKNKTIPHEKSVGGDMSLRRRTKGTATLSQFHCSSCHRHKT